MSQGKGLLGGAPAGLGITHNHNQPTLHAAYMENIENLNHMYWRHRGPHLGGVIKRENYLKSKVYLL